MPGITYEIYSYAPLTDIQDVYLSSNANFYVGVFMEVDQDLIGKMKSLGASREFYYIRNGANIQASVTNWKLLRKPPTGAHYHREWQQAEVPVSPPINAIVGSVNSAGKKLYVVKIILGSENAAAYFVEGENTVTYEYWGITVTTDFHWLLVSYDTYP